MALPSQSAPVVPRNVSTSAPLSPPDLEHAKLIKIDQANPGTLCIAGKVAATYLLKLNLILLMKLADRETLFFVPLCFMNDEDLPPSLVPSSDDLSALIVRFSLCGISFD